MKTLTIDGTYKKITIAYEPKERITRKQLTDLLTVCIKKEKVYGKYCELLRFQDHVNNSQDSIIVNKELLNELKIIAGEII